MHQLPEGFSSTRASLADLERIHDLEERFSLHHLGIPGFSLDRLKNEYLSPGFVVDQSVCLVEDQSGRLVGVGEVWERSNPPVHPLAWIFVDPNLENQGLEDFLLAWAEERARQNLERVDPELRVVLRAMSVPSISSLAAAKSRAGMSKIRYGYRMRIEMQEPPPLPEWPAGVSLRSYDPERDARTVYQVDAEVFQDHFGFIPEEPEEGFQRFMHHLAGDDSYDPSLWFLATAGEEVIGICICRRYGIDDWEAGYISSLGVTRPWRRQGIALALLQHAFGEFYRRGKTKVDLGVDGESLTGATDLYLKAGMFVLRQYDTYEKELRPGKEVSVTSLEPSEAKATEEIHD